MLVGIFIVLGWANGLAQQIPVTAMSRIESYKHQEIATGSTLITILRSIAATLGVALLSNIVQLQTQVYMKRDASQGISGELFTQQSSLLALHDSFLLASFIAVAALVTMYFVPRKRKNTEERPKQTSMLAQTPFLEEASLLQEGAIKTPSEIR